MIAETVSLISGAAVILASLMVVKTYWRRLGGPKDGAYYLALAIVAGFLSTALDAAWWQGIVNLFAMTHGHSIVTLRQFGLYFDAALKAVAVVSAYLHLRAVQVGSDEEMHWWDVPWHPKKLRICDALCRRLHK